jgi:hypothetical protein
MEGWNTTVITIRTIEGEVTNRPLRLLTLWVGRWAQSSMFNGLPTRWTCSSLAAIFERRC